MIAVRSVPSGRFSSYRSLAFALALGFAGATLSAVPAHAAGATYSKPFTAVAAPIQGELDKVKKAPDAAAVAALKTKVEAAIAAATTPDDKMAAGNYGIQVGGLAQDNALQRQGVLLMIESGKSAPDMLPRLHFYAGNFAYEMKDYDAARKEIDTAIASGFNDPDAFIIMAQVLQAQKQDKESTVYLKKAIDAMTAQGKVAPESWYRSALAAAYGANDYAGAQPLSIALVKAYPTTKSWSMAIVVQRDLAKLPSQDTLDLLRLMARTKSWTEERDYGEFVQAADTRRNPGEVKAVIDAGVAAGQVDASKQFYAENLKLANARIAMDKATLPGLDKDARLPTAKAATLAGAGDAFLSYGEGAKAAELYKLALDKPGVDKPVVLTRLGIALIDSGDYAGAKAAFLQVEGVRKGMAELWATYADQKAAGK